MARQLPSPKVVPWTLLLEAAVIVRDHWRRVPERDRARLTDLLRQSKGRYGNLSPAERTELRRLVTKLEPLTLGRNLLPFAAQARGRRRRIRR